jgi:MFS family permease
MERMAGQAVFLARRSVHHLRTFIPALAGGLRWYANRRGLSSAFLGFLGAQSLFNVGMTIFYLLYNLYLLKLGFHEDFVGLVAGATTTGTIVGTLPAGFLISRFGIKPALLFAFTAAPLMCAVRAIGADPNLLLGAAFLSGFAMSLYAVALTPATAQLVAEPARPRAFSLVCSLGIGIGIIGSMLGGALPEWAGGLTPTLLAACAIAGFGGVAALRLPLPAPASRTPHSYPRDPVIFRYLAALSLWSLATGALNPFFNVYFASELRAPIHAIGLIFSASQLTQTVAVLAAPLVLRHFGMPAGIMAMQIATGAMLALLATMPPLAGAAALYAAYMAFQYMSEPGMWTFLMDRARPEERGGAAALNMLIVFAGQAIAATVSGFALRRFGYAAVLVAASLLAVVAGLCFRAALSPRARVLVERSA